MKRVQALESPFILCLPLPDTKRRATRGARTFGSNVAAATLGKPTVCTLDQNRSGRAQLSVGHTRVLTVLTVYSGMYAHARSCNRTETTT